MTSEVPTKLKKKYLKQAHRLISLKSNSPPKRKLQVTVEPYRIHNQHDCCGSGIGCHANCENHPISSEPARHGGKIQQCCDLCNELKSMLKVQVNVNKELKRLLIASIGSDFQHQLEQIVHEKAELSCELDAASEQLITGGEEMDRVIIEGDIWRSKFVASRLLIDEFSHWKAELSAQYEESQRALRCMLQEIEELSQTLLLAMTHLDKAIELHDTANFPGVKIVHRTKPLTVLDVGQTLHAMSQTLCHHTAYENMGADDFPVQICEPTVGELLARQALLTSQFRKFQERSFPLPLKLNNGDVRNHLVQNSCSTLKHEFPSEHMTIPFCCKCKGELVVI